MKLLRIFSAITRFLVVGCLIFLQASLLQAADSAAVDSAKPALSSSTNLLTRTFKVDTNTLWLGVENVEGIVFGDEAKPAVSTDAHMAKSKNERLRDFFTSVGIDLQAPKNLFYNDTNGTLMVRATAQDLDIVEQVIEVLNIVPPQVNIVCKFVEVPTDKFALLLAKFGLTKTNLARQWDHLLGYPPSDSFATNLAKPRADDLLKTFEKTKEAKIISCPEMAVKSGFSLSVPSKSSTDAAATGTNGASTPSADLVPYVSADGRTVQLVMIPNLPKPVVDESPEAQWLRNTPELQKASDMCHFGSRTVTSTAVLESGQTHVWADYFPPSAPQAGDAKTKTHIIFVTPTVIAPAGDRIPK